MMKTTLPRAFIIRTGRLDDGRHQLLHQHPGVRTAPQVIHLHNQSRGGGVRQDPDAGGTSPARFMRQPTRHSRSLLAAAPACGVGNQRVDDRQAGVTFAKPVRRSGARPCSQATACLCSPNMTATPGHCKGQLDGPGRRRVRSLPWTAPRSLASMKPVTRDGGGTAAPGQHTLPGARCAARLPALQNNTIDATGVGTLNRLICAARTRASRSGAPGQLVSLHPQRCAWVDPRRRRRCANDRQGHRPHHRQGRPIRRHQRPRCR